jgi:AcrR family transcriptional regulator
VLTVDEVSSRTRRSAAAETDGRRLRWQAHRQARRQALIDAAIRAIHRHGSGVGMDQIAAEAGTSKPVVYRYFADKADLYLAVGQQVAQILVDRITAAMDGQPDGHAMVAAGVDAYLRTIEEEPELYRFVVHHTLLDRPVENDVVADYSSLLGNFLARRLGDLMREVGLDSGAAEPWGFGVVGLVRSAGEWWLERQTMSRQALADYVTSLIWTGFAGAYEVAGVEIDSRAPIRLLHPQRQLPDA